MDVESPSSEVLYAGGVGAAGREELSGGEDRQRKVAQRVVLAGILGG